MQTQAVEIPTTAREFERWLCSRLPGQGEKCWPQELHVKGERALLTLKSMDQPAFAQSEVLQRESAKDLQAFATAYSEFKSHVQRPDSPLHGWPVSSAEAPASTGDHAPSLSGRQGTKQRTPIQRNRR